MSNTEVDPTPALDALRRFVEQGTVESMFAARAALADFDKRQAVYEAWCKRRASLTHQVVLACTADTLQALSAARAGQKVTAVVSAVPGNIPLSGLTLVLDLFNLGDIPLPPPMPTPPAAPPPVIGGMVEPQVRPR